MLPKQIFITNMGIDNRNFQQYISTGVLPDFDQTADLTECVTGEELSAKEVGVRGGEVRLDQIRALEMIKDKTANIVYSEYPKALKTIPVFLSILKAFQYNANLNCNYSIDDLDKYLEDNLNSILEDKKVANTIKTNLLKPAISQSIAKLKKIKEKPVLSHRFYGLAKEEQSFEALKEGLDQKIAEGEFDIRFSKDKVAVIIHNATLGSFADDPRAICQMSSEELKAVRSPTGERLCTLEEFFQLLATTKNEVTKINIDIKDFDEQGLDSILSLINKYKVEHRVVFVSWFPQVLQYLYEKNVTLPYSLSYHPPIRLGLQSLALIKKMYNLVYYPELISNSSFLRFFSSKISKKRAENLNIKGELIRRLILVDPNVHWTAIVKKAQKNDISLAGGHPAAFLYNIGEMMKRVLMFGSTNTMALTEISVAFHKTLITNAKGRLSFFGEYAEDLAKNEILANVHDLANSRNIEEFFKSYKDTKIPVGTVYSKNPGSVERLKI